MKAFFIALCMVLTAGIAAAQDNYVVRPGDTLRIEVLEDGSLNRDVIVLPDGRFSFPYAGTVSAGGRTLGQIEAAVGSAIASNFSAAPSVFASIVALRPAAPRSTSNGAASSNAPTISVYFLGEVASPGGKAVPPGTTLLQALSVGGGFTNFAATKRNPRRSRRAVTSPISPRCTPSGFTSTSERSTISSRISIMLTTG